MKRLIPIVILLAAAVAVGIYFYPRLKAKPAPANEIALSGNIEAHESLLSFKVPGRVIELPIEEGQQVKQNEEFGFIRFGSRVDIYFPAGTRIDVKIGDVVQGGVTVLGSLV